MGDFMKKLILPLLLACVGNLAAAESRPNVIVILSDDIGYSDLGCYGGEISTPNLDRLAQGGLRFTQFYNTARCCPTRASLLTGLYPHQAGVGYMTDMAPYSTKAMINEWYAGDLRADTVTMAEVLRGAGYATYAVGKWHVTKNMREDSPKDNWPLQRGFDHYYGVIPGGSHYFAPTRLTRDNAAVKYDADPEYPVKNFYLTDAFSDHAVRYVREHAQQQPDKPFFMYLAYTAAHWPLHAKPEDIAKYSGKYDVGYTPIREQRFAKQKQLGVISADTQLSPQSGDWSKVTRKDWEARRMEVFAAQVDNMDQGIGLLIAELKRTGQFENTLILYLQDNGACAEVIARSGGDRPLKEGEPLPMPGTGDTWLSYGEGWANVSSTPFRLYKHYTHEGGIATPLIAHWPRGIARRGEFERQPGHLIDIMATLADLAGATYPKERAGQAVQPMEGKSLLPAFAGKVIAREAIFFEHEGNRALRIGDWKLVAKGPDTAWELYHLGRDSSEMNNLAPREPQRVAEMAAEWDRWARRSHAVPWPWQLASPKN
jgi:arylsulfatase A-like enzyme